MPPGAPVLPDLVGEDEILCNCLLSSELFVFLLTFRNPATFSWAQLMVWDFRSFKMLAGMFSLLIPSAIPVAGTERYLDRVGKARIEHRCPCL